MSIETRFHVEQITRHGTALYLAYSADTMSMIWTTDAESAFPYEDEDEAHEDADKHGGEVFSFQRWSPDRHYPGEAARLERAFGATLIAAE
ncbi:hypothetical protein [Rhizobium lentis]|uniref:Uncharacterized protein n=1 Tax=Rhizobium lentis TaxID=1138194 RepID=A0ABS7IBW7_9HYPH|nr:hypothetical protein [Rhizobium lentis]MBX5089383.1 hypothetical protein [Rhizobium lentis]